MVTREDLLELLGTSFKRFLYDIFLSTERWIFTKTGTAIEDAKIFELKLSTGIAANSTLKARYDYQIFNPVYGKGLFHVQFNSIKNVFAFFGFKEKVDDPTSVMDENVVGVMVENSKIYFVTGYVRGSVHKWQKVEIKGVDPTHDLIFKIDYNKLYTYPFPYFIPYMDTFRLITPDRVWTLRQSNDIAKPDDMSYYLMFFIKNTTGEDKFIRIKKVIYGEEYAD